MAYAVYLTMAPVYARCSSQADLVDIQTKVSSFLLGFFFYLVCITSVIQLILCIRAQAKRPGKAHIAKAFRVTIQQLLYVFIIIATGSRALYFSVQEYIPETWKNSLLSSYYPFIMSGYSLIICFWAEIFHIGERHPKNSRFLTKSYVAFAIFNVVIHTLLFAQFISSKVFNIELKGHLTEIFDGLFAFLMLVVLIFFLIYGVEIFCKIRGKFIAMTPDGAQINSNMVFQSRIGIIAQGLLQLATTFFLVINVVGSSWKKTTTIGDRNVIEIVFRILELGVALWFPCVLWNANKPEELWLLNPGRLLNNRTKSETTSLIIDKGKDYNTFDDSDAVKALQNVDAEESCWICYDNARSDVGELITPCQCKGDTSIVHEGCLKKWLIESVHNLDVAPTCRICKAKYHIHEGSTWYTFGFQKRACLQTVVIIALIIGAPVATGLSLHRLKMDLTKIVAIGGLLLFEYICFRILGVNFLSTMRRARIHAFKILDAKSDTAAVAGEEKDQNPTEVVPI